MSRKMLKGGGEEDNLLNKIKNMEIDINNHSPDELGELKKNLETLKTYEPNMLSILLIREIVDKFGLNVNVPNKNETVTKDARSKLVSDFITKMSEYIQSKRAKLQDLGSDGGAGVLVNPDALPPPVPIDPALTEGVGREGGEDVNPDVSQQSRLSNVDLGEIGFTKSDNGTFTPTEGDRHPNRGENQKKFIISKSEEINKALKQEGIKERVDQGAITNYNTAMEAAANKGYLGEGFVRTPILQGGKRSRRRRSKTRSRRTKNKRKNQYKR